VSTFINQAIGLAELEDIRLLLTDKYIQAGYINSGVIIPKQQAFNGELTFQVIEGVLNKIDIKGNERLDPDYIRDRLWKKKDEVLNTYELQKRFQALLADPLIERLNGALKPSTKLGESYLELDVERAKAFNAKLGVDNYHAPSSGAEAISLQTQTYNLSGYGDYLAVNANKTKAAHTLEGSYAFTLNAQDRKLLLDAGVSRAKVVEKPLQDAGISSHYYYLELGLNQPVFTDNSQKLLLELRLAHKKSQTFLLGSPSPFDVGADEKGISKTTELKFSQFYTQRQRSTVLALGSVFSLGIDAFGATISNRKADGKFFNWLGQVQYAQRFESIDGQLLLRSNIQLSNDSLLSMQRFALGGMQSVRGYRENSLVNDNGLFFSIAYQYPLFRDKVEKLAGTLSISPFFDAGSSWEKNNWQTRKSLTSLGFDIAWQSKKFKAKLTIAHGFKKITNPNAYNLQDDGINFELSYDLY